MKLKRKEFIIFAVILAAALLAVLVMHIIRSRKDYGSIRIWAQGEDFGTYSLGKNQKIDINGTNVCEIKDGKVKMIEADCPDQLCVYMPEIGDDGGLIICLPNGVLIEGITVSGSNP